MGPGGPGGPGGPARDEAETIFLTTAGEPDLRLEEGRLMAEILVEAGR